MGSQTQSAPSEKVKYKNKRNTNEAKPHCHCKLVSSAVRNKLTPSAFFLDTLIYKHATFYVLDVL